MTQQWTIHGHSKVGEEWPWRGLEPPQLSRLIYLLSNFKDLLRHFQNLGSDIGTMIRLYGLK